MNIEPAFPLGPSSAGGEYSAGYDGLTKREYFAAHAPVTPQEDWFSPVMPPKPQRPPRANDPSWGFNEEQAGRASKWLDDPCWDIKDDDAIFAQFNDNWNKYDVAISEWNEERNKQILIQWPWAWADAMLAAREVK